jgi:hypothetical protein
MYIFLHNIDQEIELCFEDLREKRRAVVRFNRKDIKNIRESLIKEISVIKQAKAGDFTANPSILCFWCGYNHICPAARLGKDADGSSRVETPGPVETTSNTNASANGEFQGACPQCGGELRERKGKFGAFIGCTNYPDCRYTREVGQAAANPAQSPDVEGKDICPECGSLLKQRKGRFGSFMGCTGYPQCRFTRPI